MSVWSVILFLLAALYFVGAIFEFPIMFEGNPKTRFFISKMGRKNFKIMLFVFAAVFFVLAVMLR